MPKVCLLSHLEADNLDPLDGDILDLEDASQQIEWRLAGAVETKKRKKFTIPAIARASFLSILDLYLYQSSGFRWFFSWASIQC